MIVCIRNVSNKENLSFKKGDANEQLEYNDCK